MDPVRRATLRGSRERRNRTNDELPTMVKREALGCRGIWKNTQSDDLEREGDPILARISAKPAA